MSTPADNGLPGIVIIGEIVFRNMDGKSLILVPVVSLLTPKPDQTLVDEAFSCYDRKVLVRQRQALGERD